MEPSWPLSWKSGATRRGPRPHAFAASIVARQTRTSRNIVPAATQTSIPSCASHHIMCGTPVIMVLVVCDYMPLWLTRICRLEQTHGYFIPQSWFQANVECHRIYANLHVSQSCARGRTALNTEHYIQLHGMPGRSHPSSAPWSTAGSGRCSACGTRTLHLPASPAPHAAALIQLSMQGAASTHLGSRSMHERWRATHAS